MNYIRTIITTIATAITLSSFSSSLCIQNVQLSRDGEKLIVSFDLSWENSWSSSISNNHDGVWVFAKLRLDNGDWRPVYFDEGGHDIWCRNSASHTDFELGFSNVVDHTGEIVSRQVLGIFLYHDMPITGHTTDFENTKLVFDQIRNSISEDDVVSIRVFGIEMVYVPTGAFELGDNSTENRFIKYGTVFHSTANNTFNWHDENLGDDQLFPSRTSLFPVTSHIYSVVNVMAPGIGRVSVSDMDGHGPTRGPWAPFGMVSRGNNTEDRAFWESGRGNARWQWIEFQFEGNARASGYYFVVKSRTGVAFRPQGFYVTASNDGVNWTVVAGHEGHAGMGTGVFGPAPTVHGVYIPFRIHTPGSFNRYRFHFYTEAAGISFIGFYDDYRFVNVVANEYQMHFANLDNVISPDFPKGYRNFWAMKYELTQSAWVDFLNTLTYDQQLTRVPGLTRTTAVNTNMGGGRNWIRVRSVDQATGRFTFGMSVDGVNWDPVNNAGHVAMFGLSWADMAAFADWSGLRPLTELEFEKMSRGILRAMPNEYAWGSHMIREIQTTGLANLNRPNETQNRAQRTSAGNVRTSPDGQPTHIHWPMRVGAFAEPRTSSRMEAGATFYGIMNTNDNVAERYINISTPEGRAFTGEHGDGRLNSIGNADVLNWPGVDSRGTGYRGFFNNRPLTVSCRSAMDNVNAGRNPWAGFRGGRTSNK
jgi:hypothetical protein